MRWKEGISGLGYPSYGICKVVENAEKLLTTRIWNVFGTARTQDTLYRLILQSTVRLSMILPVQLIKLIIMFQMIHIGYVTSSIALPPTMLQYFQPKPPFRQSDFEEAANFLLILQVHTAEKLC